MSSGYGCASLAHLARHSPAVLTRYSRASTIGDYVVWLLLNVKDGRALFVDPALHPPHQRGRLGFYDIEQQRWEVDRCGALGSPHSPAAHRF